VGLADLPEVRFPKKGARWRSMSPRLDWRRSSAWIWNVPSAIAALTLVAISSAWS
jgi:hypothetical protein